MDSRVAVRFYRATESARGVGELGDILQGVMALGGPADRERDIGTEVVVRMEGCSERGQTIEGDLCRVQRVNIPPQAGADGLAPIDLQEGNGIGHMAAFLYHRPTRVLALQTNIQSASPHRLALYLAALDPAQIFHFAPVLTEDAIERFQAGHARSLIVKFAGIDRLDCLDDENVPVAHGAKLIGDAYDGLDVEIKISVGRKRNRNLAPRMLRQTVDRLMGAPGIEKLQAKLEGEELPIDLLGEQLQRHADVRFPEGQPARHYAIRQEFIRNAFGEVWPTLERQFGAR